MKTRLAVYFLCPICGRSVWINLVAIESAADRRSQSREDARHANHGEFASPSGLRTVWLQLKRDPRAVNVGMAHVGEEALHHLSSHRAGESPFFRPTRVSLSGSAPAQLPTGRPQWLPRAYPGVGSDRLTNGRIPRSSNSYR